MAPIEKQTINFLKERWKILNHKLVFEIEDRFSEEFQDTCRWIEEIEENLSSEEVRILELGFNADFF